MKNIAVIFAGGYGLRMQSPSTPKQFLEVNGKPVIIYTLELFERHPMIDAICIACIEPWIPYLQELVEKYALKKVVSIVPGGETGQDSIYNGLCAAEKVWNDNGNGNDNGNDNDTAAPTIRPSDYDNGNGNDNDNDVFVLIHDGVRPLVHTETITENIRIAHEKGNCITCVPATETFVVRHREGDTSVPERDESIIARAPQTFRLSDIMAAHQKARAEGRHDYIDSCTMMHHCGYPLNSCIGSYENIKITTPTDFFIFRAILKMREDQKAFGV